MACLPKCYSVALNNLLTTLTDKAGIRAPTQCGFRKNYRVEDNSVILRTILQKCKFIRSSTFLLFVDLQKAYDSVDRSALWAVMM